MPKKMKIQTEAFQVLIDAQLLSSIDYKVSKLALFFNRISEASVLFKYEYFGEKRERVAEVKIHLPNGIIFIKESSKTFEAALDKALVGLKMQLLRYKAKRLGYCFA
jgi:putative sigma-54 modulation protein